MWNTVVKPRCQFFAKEVKRIQYDQPRVIKLLNNHQDYPLSVFNVPVILKVLALKIYSLLAVL